METVAIQEKIYINLYYMKRLLFKKRFILIYIIIIKKLINSMIDNLISPVHSNVQCTMILILWTHWILICYLDLQLM